MKIESIATKDLTALLIIVNGDVILRLNGLLTEVGVDLSNFAASQFEKKDVEICVKHGCVYIQRLKWTDCRCFVEELLEKEHPKLSKNG